MRNLPLRDLLDAIPRIVSRLRNEFLLAAIALLILVVVMGVVAPGLVPGLGRGFFYLLVILCFLAYALYLLVRVLTVYWQLRPQPPALHQPPAETLQPTRKPVPSDVLRDRYLRELVRRCAHVQMHTIDIKTATRPEAAKLDLAAVFTDLDVYDAGWEEGKDRRRGEPTADLESADRRLPVLAALSRCHRLVLLGEAGSGKSTLVNFVTLCIAGEWLDEPEANLRRLGESWQLPRLLPIHVVLRDYAARGLPQDRALWDFVGDELAAVDTKDGPLSDSLPILRSYLDRENGAILLLDGLDEVPEAHRYRLRLKEAVERFVADFPNCRVVVTSRPYGYQDPEAYLALFDVRTLAPFTPEQVEAFIRSWYRHVGIKDPQLGPRNAARYADQLVHAVQTNPRLADLAPNPLLLTLMASLHRWQEGGSLPEKRQELYEQSVKLLLDLWQRPKQVFDAAGNPTGKEYDVFTELGIPQDNLRAALNKVAYEAHRDQPEPTGTHDIRAGDLAGALYEAAADKDKAQDEQRIIEYLVRRAGLLIERDEGRVYAFPHRTFQEYMASCYFAQEDYPYPLAEHLRSDDDRWREVALLAAAKAADSAPSTVWTLVSVLCPVDWPPSEAMVDSDWYAALRASQALVETRQHLKVPDRVCHLPARLRDWLEQLVVGGHLPGPERAAAGRTLAVLGDRRPGVGITEGPDGLLLPDVQWCFVPPGPFLMGSRREDDPEAWEDELPQHPYDIPGPYWISRYPVTNRQLRAFVDDPEGYRGDEWWTRAGLTWRGSRAGPDMVEGVFDLPNHPAVMITWYEAVAYCRWLTPRLREDGAIPNGWEVRLPSEAQWEKAARGEYGRIWPWGNDWDPERCNSPEGGPGRTTPVGHYSPQGDSEYGAADMAGNVWEWCSTKWPSSYEDYGEREDNELEGEAPRVVRGGSFAYARRRVRCAFRDGWAVPGHRLRDRGFRVVAAPVSGA